MLFRRTGKAAESCLSEKRVVLVLAGYSIFKSLVTRSEAEGSAVARRGERDKVTDGLELELMANAPLFVVRPTFSTNTRYRGALQNGLAMISFAFSIFLQNRFWKLGRVVDCTGLENRHTARYPGFESLSFRQNNGCLTVFKRTS